MAAPLMASARREVSAEHESGATRPTIQPPSPHECAAVWDEPIPAGGSPGLWLLGAHGGAGVSTLCRWVGPAGDAQRQWPGGHGRQSPFVVVVTEESVAGMNRAHGLVRQYATGGAGEHARLLGVATVARVPGRRPQQVRQRRDVLAGLLAQISGGNARMWAIPFVAGLNTLELADLPVWSLGQEPTTKRRPAPREAVPATVADFGTELIDAARTQVAAWGGR